MTYNPDDLGLDLQRAAALPECEACRKKSDGAKVIGGVMLCGTHRDEFWQAAKTRRGLTPAEFASELRAGRYRACWEATIDE